MTLKKFGFKYIVLALFLFNVSFAASTISGVDYRTSAETESHIAKKETGGTVSLSDFNTILNVLRGWFVDDNGTPDNALDNKFGIGTTNPVSKLHVNIPTTDTSGLGVYFRRDYQTVTANATNYKKALEVTTATLPISSGVTDSGYRIGLAVQGYTTDPDFKGTLGSQYGIWARAGSHTSNPTGTITNSYAMFLDNVEGGATVINKYGLYQSNPTAKNYFAGNVGIGTYNPKIDLAIGDTDTGFQQQGDGELAIYTNNVERVRINSTGNVGIGDTTPDSKLDVEGGDIRISTSGKGLIFSDGTKKITANLPKADFDSGWFSMSSQAGDDSFKEITHGLGTYPNRVKVLVKAIDGNNVGFIFEGTGSSQSDDDATYSHYGGVVFAYDQTRVRLWAPDRNNNSAYGRIINIHDGWGGERLSQNSNSAHVKVLAWR